MAREIIYCAGGNARFAQIAIDAGWLYGSQLPETVYHPLYFADHDYKRPNMRVYIDALARHKPYMATALDWEREDPLPDVLGWAEEIAQHVEVVVLIPKVQGGIVRLPLVIGGKTVRLGYSVPTKYGGTELPIWEFKNWPIHLLGGSPHKQMQIAHYLDVHSVDGNYAHKIAIKHCQFWAPGDARYARDRFWPKLEEADGCRVEIDAPYEAFKRSCINIMREWRRLRAGR